MTSPVRIHTPSMTARIAKLLGVGTLILGSAAQAVCLSNSSGTGQAVVKGSAIFSPLVASGSMAAPPTLPPNETFNWSVGAPAIFVDNGSQTLADSPNWITSPGTITTESVQGIYIPPTTPTGSITATVSSASCPTSILNYTINIGDLLNPTNNKLAGDNQAVSVGGTSMPFEVGLTHTDPGGGPTVLGAVNVPVMFTLSGSGVSFHPANPVTTLKVYSDGGGISGVIVYVSPTATPGSSFSVTASPPGYPTQTFNASITGTPAMNIVTGNGLTGEPGTTSGPIKVETLMSGTPVSVPVTFEVVDGDATIVESGTTIHTSNYPGSQQYVFIHHGTMLGSLRVIASASGFPNQQFILNTVPAGVVLVRAGDGQVLMPEQQGTPVELATVNSSGSPITGLPVTLTVTTGNAVFAESGSTALSLLDSDNDGLHHFSLIAGAAPGAVEVVATSPGLADGVVHATIQGTEPPQQLIVVSGDGQSATVGSLLPNPLVVEVPLPQSGTAPLVTFTVSSGAAVFADNQSTSITVTPDGQQRASVPLRLGNSVGAVTITASAPNYLSAQFQLQALPPGPGLVMTASAVATATTGLPAGPLVVSLTDNDQAVAATTIQWQVISGDLTLAAPTSTTAADGHAQVAAQAGLTAGSILVRATASVSGRTVSADFAFASAHPTLSVVGGDHQSGPIGTLADVPIDVQLRGGNGQPLTGQTVGFTVVGAGSLDPASATTDASGKASTRLRYGNSAGAVTVQASAMNGRATASASAQAYLPSLSIVSGDHQTALAGTALAQPLVLKLASPAPSALNNAKSLGGVVVTWHVTCGNGALETGTTTTNANGESQNRLVLGTAPGCNTVEAAIPGIGAVQFQATGTVPGNSVLELVSGNGQSLAPGVTSAPLKVRLRTASGDPIQGVVIHFASARTEAQIAEPDVATAADGTAQTTVRTSLPMSFVVRASVRDLPGIAAVDFALTSGLAQTPGLDSPQERIAHAIDTACPALAQIAHPTPQQLDLLQRCSELYRGAQDNPGEVRDALGRLLAHKGSAQNTSARRTVAQQFDHLASHFSAVRGGARGVDLNGLSVLTGSGALPLSLLPSAIALAAGEPPEEVGAEFSRWGFFATGTIGRGERDPDTFDPGFRYDNYDLTAGIDYRLTDSWILGAAIGFDRNTTDVRNDLGGFDSNGWTLSAYASWFKGSSWYLDAVLGVGQSRYDFERRIRYGVPSASGGRTLIDQVASARSNGDRQSLSLSFGRDFAKGAWTVGPYVRAAYAKMDFDAYTETMSNPDRLGAGLAMSVDARSIKSLQAVVGGKVSYALSTSWGVLVPSAQFEWVQELEDDPDLLVTRFAFDPSRTPILVENERIDDSYFNLGVGLSGVFSQGRSAYVYYEHVAGQQQMSADSLAIGVRIEF